MTRFSIFSVVFFCIVSVVFSQDLQIAESGQNHGIYVSADKNEMTIYIKKSYILDRLSVEIRKVYEKSGAVLQVGGSVLDWQDEVPMSLNGGYYVCTIKGFSNKVFGIYYFHLGGKRGDKNGNYIPGDIFLSGKGNMLYSTELVSNGIVDANGNEYYNFRCRVTTQKHF